MDALSMLKFWRISTTTARVTGAAISDGDVTESASFDDCSAIMEPVEEDTDSEVEYDDDEDDDDDSFYEMEFTLPDYYGESKIESVSNSEPKMNGSQQQNDQKFTRIGDLVSSSTRSPLASDKSKTRQKPQSPISILKSAPKLRVSMFGKLKKSSVPTKEADRKPVVTNLDQQKKSSNNNLFIKFRIEDESTAAKNFPRTGSSKPVMSPINKYSSSASSNIKCDDLVDVSSRRFSKDSMQKYLNLIKKPMYVKVAAAAVSKRSSAKSSTGCETHQFNLAGSPSKPYASPSSSKMSPAPPIASPRRSEEKLSSRLRAPLKNLGKSRSGNALLGSPSSTAASNRKDDSLVQQNDGIQGAILHCKQSLKSSDIQVRSSLLSRCSSDPSYEKSLVQMRTQ